MNLLSRLKQNQYTHTHAHTDTHTGLSVNSAFAWGSVLLVQAFFKKCAASVHDENIVGLQFYKTMAHYQGRARLFESMFWAVRTQKVITVVTPHNNNFVRLFGDDAETAIYCSVVSRFRRM